MRGRPLPALLLAAGMAIAGPMPAAAAQTPPAAAKTKPDPDDASREDPSQPAPVERAPAVPSSFLDENARWQRTAAWVSVGVSALFLTTGAVLGTSARAREDNLQRLVTSRDPTTGLPRRYAATAREDYEDSVEEGEMLEAAMTGALIGAGVAAGAAAVFFWLDARAGAEAPGRHAERALVPVAGPGGLGVVAAWTF